MYMQNLFKKKKKKVAKTLIQRKSVKTCYAFTVMQRLHCKKEEEEEMKQWFINIDINGIIANLHYFSSHPSIYQHSSRWQDRPSGREKDNMVWVLKPAATVDDRCPLANTCYSVLFFNFKWA